MAANRGGSHCKSTRPRWKAAATTVRSISATDSASAALLPASVRDLATQLAINPNTIQRAYRRLEAEGWIATVPGKGCFVCGDGEIREREKKRLLLSFDEAAAALLTMGASHGELVARIEKGDHRHA